MVYVGSSWVELDYWTSPSWGDYDARMRVLAYSTQDIASNTSRVYFKIQKRVTGGSAYNYDNRDFRITGTGAEGDGHSATQTWNFGSVSDTSWVDVGGDTSDMYWSSVKHRDDGSLTLTATASGDRPLSGTFSGDISIQLPTIARASVPSAGTNPLTIGSSGATVTINTNRKSSSFTHTVTLSCGSWSSQKTGVGASSSFTVPYSVVGQFGATSKTATCTITCVTYNGSTNIGTKTATFTLQINTSVDHPNVGTITVTDTNTKTSSILSSGQFAYGISTLQATIPLTVSGSYTQLASATVTCGTKTQTYSLSGTSQSITFTFDKVDVSSLTVTVKDKRGTSATKTKSWTLLGYSPLTASATVGRPSATGSTAVGQVSGVAYGGTYGGTANSLTIKVQSKLHSASSYGNTETYTQAISGTGQQTYTRAITFTHSFDYTNEYDIRFTVSDLFSTATYTCRLVQGLPIISWDETEADVWGNFHVHYRGYPAYYYQIPESFNGVQYYDGIKNLLPNYAQGTTTMNGLTFSVSAIGVVTVNGTATEQTIFSRIFTWGYGTGDFYFSGCPSGGSDETYDVYMWDRDANARPKQWDESTAIVSCYGNTLDQSRQVHLVNGTSYNFSIRIESGVTCSNLIFYPMIRHNTVASNTFIPHAPTNRELEANAHKLNYSSVVTPLSAIRTTDWSYTAPSDGQFTSTIISTTRSYVEISINNVKVGAVALTTNSSPQAVPISYVLSKGDVISFTGITANCYISNSYTHLIPYL